MEGRRAGSGDAGHASHADLLDLGQGSVQVLARSLGVSVALINDRVQCNLKTWNNKGWLDGLFLCFPLKDG